MGDRGQDGDRVLSGCWEQGFPNPALQVRENFLHKPISRVGVQNFLRPSAVGGCSVLPQVHSLLEAASDGVGGQGEHSTCCFQLAGTFISDTH